MLKQLGICLALAMFSTATLSACSNTDVAGDTDSATGTLRLPVVTPDGVYRLRQAIFVITASNGATVTLDGDADASANELRADLEPGNYTIELRNGWSLEHLDEGGAATVVAGALLSPNPTSFEVRHRRTSDVVYSFGSDEGTVSFGSGTAAISIDVASTTPASNCDVVHQTGCASGQSCLLRDDSGSTFCADAGSQPVGAACDSEQCVPGAQCLAVEGSNTRVCTSFCDPSSTRFGCVCHGLSIASNVGVCEAPPASACDLAAQTGCDEGLACQYDGGPYGTCGTPGELVAGQTCNGETCAAGLECYGDDANSGASGQCWSFCTNIGSYCGTIYNSYWGFYQSAYCRDVGRGTLGSCQP